MVDFSFDYVTVSISGKQFPIEANLTSFFVHHKRLISKSMRLSKEALKELKEIYHKEHIKIYTQCLKISSY